ncbi:MAG: hypothetical protein PHO53_00185 [Actinomycetota bacterium]|nr:hypothetical protein [Actinomycetota bacterium]
MRWIAIVLMTASSIYFFFQRTAIKRRERAKARLDAYLGEAELKSSARGNFIKSFHQTLDKTKYMSSLRQSLKSSKTSLSWETFRAIVLMDYVFLPSASIALTDNVVLAIPTLVMAFAFPKFLLRAITRKSQKKRKAGLEQLSSDLALYLQCGIPPADAFLLCIEESRLLEESVVTVSLDDDPGKFFKSLADSWEDPDLELISLAVLASNETGADIREVMGGVGKSLRDRMTTRRELEIQTTEGRLSGSLVCALPFLFLFLSSIFSPETLRVLIGTTPGFLMLLCAILLDLVGLAWIRKILNLASP